MANYDETNAADDAGAAAEARNIKLAFDRKDIKAWLTRLEIRLEFAGVKSQWLKRLCLENILPEDVAHTCKEYFCKPQTDAGTHIYKDCKNRLLEVYGSKPEEDFLKADNYVMAGLPSQAAKDLRDMMCQNATKLETCCCSVGVGARWRNLLPPEVKAQVAGMPLKKKTEFEAAIKKADEVFQAVKVNQPVSAVAVKKPATAGAKSKKPVDLDTSADAPALDQMAHLADQIAAFNKNYQKSKNSGGASRGAQQKRGPAGKPQARGRAPKPHPDGPPEEACDIHWRFGRSAYYCLSPSTCPWHDIKSVPK